MPYNFAADSFRQFRSIGGRLTQSFM